MPDVKAKAASIADSLIELSEHTEIVKHVPGVIQLKINPYGIILALNLNMKLKLNTDDLKTTGKNIGILDVKANKASRILTIVYDKEKIPTELWELLIKGKASPKIRKLVREELFRRLQNG